MLEQMWQVLFLQHGNPSNEAYLEAKRVMAIAFGNDDLSVRAYFTRYVESANVFAIVESEKISALAQITQLQQHFRNHAHYAPTVFTYNLAHNGVGNHDVNAFVEAMILRSLEASSDTVGSFAGAAQGSFQQNMEKRLAALEAENKALRAKKPDSRKTRKPKYCWSCGTADDGHGGEDCTQQKEGHQPRARSWNMMGGKKPN